MTVRKVVTRRSNHYRGYFPSLKNKKPVPWESQLEGALFGFLSCLLRSSATSRSPVRNVFHRSGATSNITQTYRFSSRMGASGGLK